MYNVYIVLIGGVLYCLYLKIYGNLLEIEMNVFNIGEYYFKML